MRILVSGGAGYIGSHITRLLKQKNLNPIIFDNLSTGHDDIPKLLDVPFEQGDICDTEDLISTFKKYEIDSVIHLAACSEVGESAVHPAKYYDNNVVGTISVLRAMRMAKVKNIVFASSCAVYGEYCGSLWYPNSDRGFLSEESGERKPTSPYGHSKLMCEQIIADYSKAYGHNYSILRFFNVAGASTDNLIGERHNIRLVPLCVQGAELPVYGNDYMTRDGTCIRDYVHVEDVARAVFVALNNIDSPDENLAIMNVGSGEGHTVLEVIKIVEEVIGKKVDYTIDQRRKGDAAVAVANIDKLKSLGWKPQYDLRAIIQTAYNYMLSQ